MTTHQLPQTRLVRWLALGGILSLMVWIALWQLIWSPHPHISPVAITIGWLVPLLLPLPGIIKGKPYTHAWANFVLMLYFLHAFTLLYIDNGERWLAAIELLFTSCAFVGNTLYARLRGKELGLKLTKLSEVERAEKAQFNRDK